MATAFTLNIKEELALIRAYIYHTKRDEHRLRRKLSSIESKIEQSRNQLRDVLKFMKQHQNGIGVHLKKLGETENTLRQQIDNIFPQSFDNNNNNNNNINANNIDLENNHKLNGGKTKQTKRAKKLNNDLIEIVQHRNEQESILDSSQSTFKLIESLLSDETKQNGHFNYNINNNTNDLLLELDDNISPSITEYLYYRQEISKIQQELVECVKKRELANQAQRFTEIALNKKIPNKCIKCQCQCIHRDKKLIAQDFIIIDNDTNDDDDDDGIESDDDDDFAIKISRDLLKSELIQLGQDIHQRSGLIRQQRRDGMCHLRVFVGSELITWMVKSNIVKTRYEATILSSLLIDGGYVYCAYSKPTQQQQQQQQQQYHHQYQQRQQYKPIKILTKHPSITLKKPKKSTSSLLSDTRSLTPQPSSLLQFSKSPKTTIPNKLLLTSTPNTSSSNGSSSSLSTNVLSTSAPSSVLSMASSNSAISGTSSSRYSNQSSSSRSIELFISNNNNNNNNNNNIECHCKCNYCIETNKSINLSFNDSNDLYRFRCDDSRIERISKMGWLEKFGRFRSKKRHYIWDGVRKQLREYKTKGDIAPLYKYPFNKDTQIMPSKNDNCILMITFLEIKGQSTNTLILKLKASTSRERDSWIRVLKNDNNNYNNNNDDNDATDNIDDNESIIDDVVDGNNNNGNNNNNNNNVDKNYEEYRHLRMTNRLKWSSLFISLKSSSSYIQDFRQFITEQNKLQRCHKTEIERELSKLFTNNDSPISILFNKFTRLFLEPFHTININELELESIDSIISLCVDDLSSFLQICQTRLINLLLPSLLRGYNNNNNNNNNKPRPVVKLLNKLIKKCIYSHCFSSSVYNTIFPLYQRIHHDIDQQLYDISLNSQHFSTKNYQISEELQIDKEWVKQKNHRIEKMLKYPQSIQDKEYKQDNDNSVDSILKIDSSKLKKTKNNIEWNFTKLMTSNDSLNVDSSSIDSPSYNYDNNDNNDNDKDIIYTESPFQPCIDKIWEMTHCHTPTKKLQCLVELQQLIIKCIDKFRQQQFIKDNQNNNDNHNQIKDDEEKTHQLIVVTNNNNDNDNDNDDDDGMSIESIDYESDDFEEINNVQNNKIKTRTHGIIIDDDDDDEDDVNVSLVSYESATSEYWTQGSIKQQQQQQPQQQIQTNKKCKQLLIASDDMIPLFCYILVQSQIQSINAEIAFMNDFMSDEEKQMKTGFYLTTLQASTSALLDKKLPIR